MGASETHDKANFEAPSSHPGNRRITTTGTRARWLVALSVSSVSRVTTSAEGEQRAGM